MARKKESKYTNWDEVDQAMKDLGELTISKAKLEGELTIKINVIKDEFQVKADGLAEKIKVIVEHIGLYAEANKEAFLKDRTKKLTFGSISFRLTEKLVIKNVKAAIAALKTLKLDNYLRVKEELNKEAMKGLDDSTLVKIGVSRKKSDSLSIEPNYEELRAAV
jgi:phage host-nuclease inhibitor protein Gam